MSNTENQLAPEDRTAAYLVVGMERAVENLEEAAAGLERFFSDTHIHECWNPGRDICRMDLLQDTIRDLKDQLAVAKIAVKAQIYARGAAEVDRGVAAIDWTRWIP